MVNEVALPFQIIVFGGTGDLARRKLFPALFWRHLDGWLPPGEIIGVARKPLDRERYIQSLEVSCRYPSGCEPCSEGDWQGFADRIDYVCLDGTSPRDYAALAKRVANTDDCVRVFYLATPPSLFGPICASLRVAGLVTPNSHVVVEKPIGHDLVSARDINQEVGSTFAEGQIFRIDHYLGKETVQNLMALRFGNALLEPIWDGRMVDHVQITVAEQLGVESRGGYYEQVGALRDMVQNHMLQLLCLVAMEPPNSLDADAVRDEKLKVLRALRPIGTNDAEAKTVRAQYRAGSIQGAAVPGYLAEEGVSSQSTTETFVAVKAEIENWRWSGVPFYLRTGKRLEQQLSEIIIQFKPVPHFIFNRRSARTPPNRLIIQLQPEESIRLLLHVKEPGRGMTLQPVYLDLSYAEAFTARSHDAYERLLMDVIRGDQTLFMRRDEVETAWTWTGSILDAWRENENPLGTYAAGTWGPSRAVTLIERDGHTWVEENP